MAANEEITHVPVPPVAQCPGAPTKVEPTKSAFGGFGPGFAPGDPTKVEPIRSAFGGFGGPAPGDYITGFSRAMSSFQEHRQFFATPTNVMERKTKLVNMMNKICAVCKETSSMKMLDEIEIILRQANIAVDSTLIDNLKRKRGAAE